MKIFILDLCRKFLHFWLASVSREIETLTLRIQMLHASGSGAIKEVRRRDDLYNTERLIRRGLIRVGLRTVRSLGVTGGGMIHFGDIPRQKFWTEHKKEVIGGAVTLLLIAVLVPIMLAM